MLRFLLVVNFGLQEQGVQKLNFISNIILIINYKGTQG